MDVKTPIPDPIVAFDKKTLYIGKSRSIKLKEMNKVTIHEENDHDEYSGRGRQYNRFSSNSFGQRRQHYGSRQEHDDDDGSTTTIMTIFGKNKSFTCITNSNIEITNFSEALKQIHRKIKVKNNEKDPYAAVAGSSSSTLGSNKRKTKTITPYNSRFNQQHQHHRQSHSSLHMTPQKMKQSSGAFLSTNNSETRTDTAATTTRGNVLQHYKNQIITSPSILNLPPKSPRNATPTKLRPSAQDSSDEEELEDPNKKPRVLFKEVVQRDKNRGKLNKLQRKIEQRVLDERSDDEEEKDEDAEMNFKEEEEVVEKQSGRKKRRLRKVAVMKNDVESDGSDMEFDDDGNSSNNEGENSASKVKKKLRLEEEEEEDEDDEENDSPSPAREEKVRKSHPSGKTITDEDTSRETSPLTTEDVIFAAKHDREDETSSSTPPDEKKPAAKKGAGTLHSFFAPRSASSSSSSTASVSSSKTKSSTTTTTLTPVPPTPVKKKRDFSLQSSTPLSHSTNLSWRSNSSMQESTSSVQVEASPMQKQNRWVNHLSASTPKRRYPSPYVDTGEHYHNRRTPVGGYGTDNEEEEEEEEEDDIYNNISPVKTPYQQHYDRTPVNNPYLKTLGLSRSGRGRSIYGRNGHSVGRARLNPNRNNENYLSRRYNNNRPSEADSALGLRGSLAARTNNRDMSRRFLGKSNLFSNDDIEEKVVKPKIPGIQNLGNTCYLSASLQTLYSIPHFLHNLYRSYEELSFTKDLPLTTALLEVAVTIGALKEEDVPMISPETARSTLLSSKAANPSALKKHMDVLTDKFAGYEQRDAHEFLGDLVDFLHEELVDSPSDDKEEEEEPKKSDDSDSEEDSAAKDNVATTVVTTDLPTDEYFHLKVKVCLKCKSCGYSRSKEELYRHLSIDIGEDDESWGVERSLEHFFQAEDREIKCEKCEDGNCATQTMEIISR